MSDNEFGGYNNNNIPSDNNNLTNSGYSDNMYNSGGYKTNSYAYTSENAPKPRKKKNKHIFLKVLAAALCVSVVGTGSVQVYKFLKATKNELEENTPASFNTDDSENGDKSISDAEELPSLLTLAARSDAKPIPDIVDSIMPSVVGVSSTFEYEPSYGLWGWNIQPQTEQAISTGTGFIVSEDGYIVTNAHVVYDESEYNAGEAIDVSVLFSDETLHEAKIIAYDTQTDIAVLKVDETGLTPAVLGDSDELRVGELVIAVGNPLGFDLFGSVTSGIVSALNRQIYVNEKNMTLIQIDAAINAGNSGGPLLNSCGQVIGINSAKMSSSYGTASVEGLGFAIPIKEAKLVIDDLINYKYVKGRPQIGITPVDVTEAYSNYFNIPMGVYVRSVIEGSAADLAGIQIGDVIIGIEGEAITNINELNEIKNKYKAGDTITLTISRNSRDIDIYLTLQEEVSGNPSEDPLDEDADD